MQPQSEGQSGTLQHAEQAGDHLTYLHVVVSSLQCLQSKRHMAFRADRPRRVPRDLPGMAVGIGDVAAEAAVRRRVGGTQLAPAETRQPVDQRLHVLAHRDVVRQREGARSSGLVRNRAMQSSNSPSW